MKNAFLNVMAAITALCMITITVFVILTAGAIREDSKKSLSKISDIEDQIAAINERYDQEETSEDTGSLVPAAPISDISSGDVEDLASATAALSEAIAQLQEQTDNLSSIDFATLNEAIERLNETSISLEGTASRISAIFG
ncbi:MAG: hypothetical protein IJ757_02850 [Clostridiales bacterium]|nr:hypothetical protein [Clostridiales bacterium]